MPSLEKANILVVDDDPIFRASVKIILDQYRDHWVTQLATSVQEANALLENTQFDLAILDVHLPDGSAADVVKAAGLMPCILCTQDNQDITFCEMFENQEIAHNIVGYLPKPLNQQVIWQIRAGLLIGKSRRMRDKLTAEATAKFEDVCRLIEQNLHDAMGAALTQLTWTFTGIEKVISEADSIEPALVENIVRLTRQGRNLVAATHAEVSKAMKDLRPEEVVVTGLKHAIEVMVDEWKTIASTVEFRCSIADEVRDVDIRRAGSIFRLVQEGITNAMRHTLPHGITIELNCRNKQLQLTIVSQGEMPQSDQENYALTILRERTASLGGMLQFNCDRKQGESQLKVLIPLFQENQ